MRSNEKEDSSIKYTLLETDCDWFRKVINCQATCPAHTAIPEYISLIVQGKLEEAYAVNKKANLFPSILGRVCDHPCETECRRGVIDDPVSICSLKRYAADNSRSLRKGKQIHQTEGDRVAIIGAGPVGLTAAYDLAVIGYRVDIFESSPEAGGMLRLGIPEYRLPRDLLHLEIEAIEAVGVKIHLDTPVTEKISFEDLRRGYKAVLIAVGAHKGLELGIPGSDRFDGIMDCVEFLRGVNLGHEIEPGRKVAVIGGGNSAIDSARTAIRLARGTETIPEEQFLHASDTARSAIRLGSKTVTLLYRRSRAEMPANSWEIDEAENEGIEIRYLTAPLRVLGEGGKVTGLKCTRMRLGEPDSSGRRRPVPIEGSEFTVACDVVIPAISQRPDLSFLGDKHGLKLTDWGTIEVDNETLAANLTGIFAGGDVVTGPQTVIKGIAAGHKAAASIDRHLQRLDLKLGRDRRSHAFFAEQPPRLTFDYDLIPRQKMPTLPVVNRLSGTDEVELGFAKEAAIKEANRCLQCNYDIFIDGAQCILCGGCIDVCPYHCINMVSIDKIEGGIEELTEARSWEAGAAMILDEESCIRCSTCVARCPTGAISMRRYELSEVEY